MFAQCCYMLQKLPLRHVAGAVRHVIKCEEQTWNEKYHVDVLLQVREKLMYNIFKMAQSYKIK